MGLQQHCGYDKIKILILVIFHRSLIMKNQNVFEQRPDTLDITVLL